ncbi:hypothetical protein ACFL6Y_04850 [Elusimicrobiota bacterium]
MPMARAPTPIFKKEKPLFVSQRAGEAKRAKKAKRAKEVNKWLSFIALTPPTLRCPVSTGTFMNLEACLHSFAKATEHLRPSMERGNGRSGI